MTASHRSIAFLLLITVLVSSANSRAVLINATVHFQRQVLSDTWQGDYGLRTVDLDGDGFQDVVAYAWAKGRLSWFQNPGVGTIGAWAMYEIAGNLPGIVDVDFFDLDSDGHVDIIAAWDLSIPVNSNKEGQIGWLKNPGTPMSSGEDWRYFPIAGPSNFIPGIHRVRIGRFMRGAPTVVGVPIFDYGASAPHFNQTVSTIRMYSIPKDLYSAPFWDSLIVNRDLHICHTLRKVSGGDFDFLLESSLEGVNKMTFPAPGKSSLFTLSSGIPSVSYSPFHGTQGVDVGNVDGVPSFLAAIAPWEGVDQLSPTTISILFPTPQNNSLFSSRLQRIDLDIRGSQGHDVATGDFNNDGCDDFLVGLRGPVHGVWLYMCDDKPSLAEWSFFPVTLNQQYGASQISVEDFNKDGKLDFAATGFPGFPGGGGGPENQYVAVYYQI